MISDDEVRQLFLRGRQILSSSPNGGPLLTQFYRGVYNDDWAGQVVGGCDRHIAIFNHFKIIPEYCFSCYKVVLVPNTVLELFKLMILFERLELDQDNSRKCIVEGRPQISGFYKGFIYCRSLSEANHIKQLVESEVKDQISDKILVSIKRGCSEFSIPYPEYADPAPEGREFEYKPEWRQFEKMADERAVVKRRQGAGDSHNKPTFDLDDYRVMLAWLKYASTIGDDSYLNISVSSVQPFQGLTRPEPFVPPGE